MWIIRRLAENGVNSDDLSMTYETRIRKHLEINVPLFHFSISKKLSDTIEKVQKACMYIILGKHASMDSICNQAILNLESLCDRRDKLCTNFAKKTIKHPDHRKMFTWIEGRTKWSYLMHAPVDKPGVQFPVSLKL